MKPSTVNLDLFIIESAEVYHSKATAYLSSHQLIDFMRCPYLFHKKRAGLIEERESTSYLIGHAAHTRILEGQAIYENTFALGGPINPITGRPYGSLTKKFAEWRELQNKPVLSQEQAELVEQMVNGVAMNPNALELISHGMPEGVLRTTYGGVPCQIRIDFVNPTFGIVDLKTCDDLTWFEADARRYGYHHQMSFYQAVLAAAGGQYVPVHLIAIEKKEPFRCGVWRLSNDCLLSARRENEAAIERLKSCHKNDLWPTGYEEIRLLDIL